jgi:hypothetical protein
MKRVFVVLIAIALLSMLGLSAAETTGNAFEITEVKVSRNGSLTIRWTDPLNRSPYRVLFQPVTSANEEVPSDQMLVWCNSGEVNGTEYTEQYVVPDSSWWFIVEDSVGNQIKWKYEAKDSGFDGSWGVEISGRSQSAKRGNISVQYAETGNDSFGSPVLKAKDIISAADNVSYGVRLSLQCKDSSLFGDYLLKYAMTAHGVAKENSPMVVGFTADTSMPLVFNKDHRKMEYYVNLSPYMKRLNNVYGDIKGAYALRVYFDGKYVADVNVLVK